MTSTDTPDDSGAPPSSERNKAFEHLDAALDADENDEKDYHIREAIQLLNIDGC